ncbi:hypothetical protein FB451DRAFT_1193910 [Mycena latifolia]|nr:hypothetical protein FB451DRAFT_1193910 [Mycena latifolia]
MGGLWTWTWRARRAGAQIYSRRVECKINEGREAKEGRAIAHTVREYYELATVRGTVSVSVPPAQLLNSWIVDGGRNVSTRRVAEKRRRNVRRDGGRRGRLRDAKEGRKPKEIKGRARGQASEARAPTEGRGTNAMKFEFPPSGRKRMMGGKATDGGAREESLPSEDRHKGGKENQKRDDARAPPRVPNMDMGGTDLIAPYFQALQTIRLSSFFCAKSLIIPGEPYHSEHLLKERLDCGHLADICSFHVTYTPYARSACDIGGELNA